MDIIQYSEKNDAINNLLQDRHSLMRRVNKAIL